MFTACIVAACLAFQAGDSVPAAPELDAQVKQLVRQLDAREKSARESAEQALLDLGPKALDLLPEPTERTSAEVKQRLARVRNKLERALAEANKEGKRVTLSGEMSLADAVRAIEQQTDNKLYLDLRDDASASTAKHAMDIQDKLFWEALDGLLDTASLDVNAYGDRAGLGLVRRSDMAAPRTGRAVYVQAFRMAPLDVSATRDYRSTVGSSLQLQLEVAWEPRLAPIVLTVPMGSLSAEDDQGRPLPLAGADGEQEVPIGPGQSTVTIPVYFELPDRSAQRIAKLKGTIGAVLPGRQESFTFAKIDQAKQVSQTKAGVTVTIEEVRKNDDVWEVRVLTKFDDAAGSLQSHLNWVLNNEAKLLTPEGEEIPYDSLEETREEENAVGMAYLFAREQGLKDHSFIYRTPISMLDVTLEFELADMELP